MKTKQVIETEVKDIRFGWWNCETEEFIDLSDQEAVSEFINRKNFKESLVDAIAMLTADVKEALELDLTDIWKRLDEMETTLKECGLK